MLDGDAQGEGGGGGASAGGGAGEGSPSGTVRDWRRLSTALGQQGEPSWTEAVWVSSPFSPPTSMRGHLGSIDISVAQWQRRVEEEA